MRTLFSNANVVDIFTGEVKHVDIYVEDGNISKILPAAQEHDFDGDIFDLNGDYVLPSFVNVFCDSLKALEQNFDISRNNLLLTDVFPLDNLLYYKNALSGCVYLNSMVFREFFSAKVLDNFLEKSESELSNFVDVVAKEKKVSFLKVGQSLQELGAVDSIFKKSLCHVLEDFGFLDRPCVIVGGNCFEKDDLELFEQYECRFCLTPFDDARQAKRPTNVVALKNRDFLVGIGSGYGFEIDFFAFMRQILLSTWGMFEDKSVLSEQDVLKMATFHGAQILLGEGFSTYGVSEGCHADFCVVRKTNSLYDDVFKRLVWEKSKNDVVMTVFGGKIIQKNGKLFAYQKENIMQICKDYDIIKEELFNQIRRKK